MKLKTKIISITTKGPLIAVLSQKDAHALDIEPLDRIKITKGEKEKVVAVDIAFGNKEIKPNEIGVFLEVAAELNLKNNDIVEVKVEPKPKSILYIKKKLDKQELTKNEIDLIIKDLLENKLTEIEATYFVSGCYANGMTLDESAHLAEAIVNNSGKIKFRHRIVTDVHSIGGLAGNRTTPVIVPIVAAAGLIIPKNFTRAITSASGSADTCEVLMPVSHTKEKIIQIVRKTNGCLVWGGTLDLASADDKLIQLEKILNLDPEGIMLASILSKKSAVDSSHILIEIPVGPEAKIDNKKTAKELAKKFIILGSKLDMKIKVLITDGSSPVGNGIGPALEARDILLVLENKGPEDLRKKSVFMAGLILEMAGIKDGQKKALNILASGKALEKLREIIKAQGGNPFISQEKIKLGNFTYTFTSSKDGKIKTISNKLVNRIAKAAGSPIDKGAGIYLHKKINEKAKKKEPLFTVYAEDKNRLRFALREDLSKVMEIG